MSVVKSLSDLGASRKFTATGSTPAGEGIAVATTARAGAGRKAKEPGLQKNWSMTKDSSDLDTQRRLCKAWLLMGRNIRSSDKCGREIHVGIRREEIDVRPEHELDAEAAEYLLSLT